MNLDMSMIRALQVALVVRMTAILAIWTERAVHAFNLVIEELLTKQMEDAYLLMVIIKPDQELLQSVQFNVLTVHLLLFAQIALPTTTERWEEIGVILSQDTTKVIKWMQRNALPLSVLSVSQILNALPVNRVIQSKMVDVNKIKQISLPYG